MKTMRATILIALALALALLTSRALAGVQAYDLPWWTVDGGGGVSSGGTYALSGAIGQAEAGEMSGGGYALVGGFWVEAAAPPPLTARQYLPMLVR